MSRQGDATRAHGPIGSAQSGPDDQSERDPIRSGQHGTVSGTVHERCEACGFDGSMYDNAALVEALRALGPSWRGLSLDPPMNFG